jgi:hypothetical protein
MIPKTKGKNKGDIQPRPDKGKLPGHVPEPIFVADRSHRRKVLNGDLIAIDKQTKDLQFTMTRMDTTRIAKNFGYMACMLKDKPTSEYVDSAKAILEHHFDDHTYCGSWCKHKDESEEERNRLIRYYRCKEKDAKLYALLSETISRFITQERLEEIAT